MDHFDFYDVPKSLKLAEVRKARLEQLNEPHTKPLTDFVEQMRKETGFGSDIPYFDPLDGGIYAKCLFLGEAPGPQAVKSGFISRNNPDNSAKNFWELQNEAGIPRQITVSWNIVPWYIGSGKKIRPATMDDIRRGEIYLSKLLTLLQSLIVVVLGGKKAQEAQAKLRKDLPKVEIVTMMHTSPLVINTNRENRGKIAERLRYVARLLSA